MVPFCLLEQCHLSDEELEAACDRGQISRRVMTEGCSEPRQPPAGPRIPLDVFINEVDVFNVSFDLGTSLEWRQVELDVDTKAVLPWIINIGQIFDLVSVIS